MAGSLAAPPSTPTPGAASATVAPPARAVSQASARQPDEDAEEDRAARANEARWCALWAERNQDLSAPAERDAIEPDEMNAIAQTEAERMERRLLQRLRADPSTRSQAAAEWLPRSGSLAGTQRLHELARQSRDPFVIALALQRPCPPNTACRSVEPGLWAEVEPNNLQAALLAAAQRTGEPAQQRWSRLLQTTEDNKQVSELIRVLEQHLPDAHDTVFLRDTQLALLIGYRSAAEAASWPSLRDLNSACRSTDLGLDRGRICEGVAEKLWASSGADVLRNVMALALVRGLPARAAQWQARAQQAEAVRQWTSERMTVEIEQLIASMDCKRAPATSPWRRKATADSEWAFIRSEMIQAGADEQALAERYRAHEGRGLLEPRPAASAAAMTAASAGK